MLSAVMKLNGVASDFAPRGNLALKPWLANDQGLALPAAIRPPGDGGGRDRVWLAASTHPGEDEIVLPKSSSSVFVSMPNFWLGIVLALAAGHQRGAGCGVRG